MSTATAPATVTRLNFSGPHLRADLVRHARGHLVEGQAIVVNPTPHPVTVDHHPRKPIPALSSAILTDARITAADTLLVIRTGPVPRPADVAAAPAWTRLSDLLPGFPATTALWRSRQDDAGTVHFDPAHLLGETTVPAAPQPFAVKVNAWYAPAGTDCGIHNEHPFIEVHTQTHGTGRMQKFATADPATRYLDLPMAPGYTTPDPFCSTTPDGTFRYPWHQYRADTDSIWLAVEYHRVTA
ncbi:MULTISPECIES: hypothetical protein [Streptomycetaceae]|uniref:Uncharacterized protein n=1 Tax=Streptantibioticus cattleyicolor (strain ATCC 35852 / DSM 46488 / JCM 4925 / NBRC 14057 / NRRL 8057) TaxID=1003195 RepID=F8JV07_STREN|nr:MULTISPECIES: hypothetical protein [Streptomycetaceae]AEW98176.1 hypothetical protein SCATT_58050 [Streptantibioticus cattleyicolor NRRL 8057 = DSM 46488]MYS62560.1 hypothetical protein [Streptomyces sp. SID5468]CCB78491.1 conserved protein of unknown function [Streptantibioticus cattleyicolor NRRL 8057 = DSM 46488]